jgi:hypothetical protein
MANTKVTGDLIASSTIATGNIADNAVTSDKISGITTAHITEGANLYYTDARADARITAATTSDLTEGTNLYYTDARADARAALLVDSAPSTLNTLNELAAALGDDPNFATTTATSIGTKLPLAGGTLTGALTGTSFNDGYITWSFAQLNRYGAAIELQYTPTNTATLVKIGANGSNPTIFNAYTGDATFGGDVHAGGRLRSDVGSDSGTQLNLWADSNGSTFLAGYNFAIHTGSNNARTESFIIDQSKNATFAGEVSLKSRLNLQRSSGGATTLIQFKNENGVDRAHIDFGGTNEELSFFAGDGTTENLRIDSAGNVGIGTTSPSQKLEVAGNINVINSNPYIWIGESGSGGGAGFIGWNDASDYLFLGHSYGSAFNKNIVINSSGNVGIGTTTPNRPLTIQSNSGATAISIYARNQDDYGFIQFFGHNQTTLWSEIAGRPSNISFYQNTSEVLRLGVASSFFLVGNVGIGTTGPLSKLELGPNGSLGANTVNKKVTLNVDGGYATTGVGSTGQYKVIGFVGTTRDVTDITGQTGGEVQKNFYLGTIGFDYFNGNRFSFWQGGVERLTIQGYGANVGNVGIGTDSPSERLSVDGNAEILKGDDARVYIKDVGDSSTILLRSDGANTSIGTDSNHDLQVQTNGSTKMVIQTGGQVRIGTTNNGSKLNVGGTIAAATNDLSNGMVVPRSYGITYGGSTFTHTFNPVALFGMSFRGGQVLLECTGWQLAMNNGYIMWRNAGGGDPIGTNGSAAYVQTAYSSGGQSGSNTIAVSLNTGTNNITITFTGWHGNSHGFACRLTTNYS